MSHQSFVPLGIQERWLVVEARAVRQVLGHETWTPIDGPRKEMPGLLQWQGRAVTLINLGVLLDGLRQLEPGEVRRRTVVVGAEDVTLALLPGSGIRPTVGCCVSGTTPRLSRASRSAAMAVSW